MAKAEEMANDMERSILSSHIDSMVPPQVDNTTVGKAENKPTEQNDRSFKDVKENSFCSSILNAKSDAARSESEKPVHLGRVSVSAATIAQEQLHKNLRMLPRERCNSLFKKMDQEDKKVAVVTKPSVAGFMFPTPKNEKPAVEPKQSTVHKRFFVPAGERMIDLGNGNFRLLPPKGAKMPVRGGKKEQLLGGEWEAVSKEEAEDEWTMV